MTSSRLDKHFNYKIEEPLIYQSWEETSAFSPNGTGKPFYIPMPPPNITGQLHLGHALFCTLQDILIRHRRQQGDDALWLPGFDHAGIATQQKLLAEMLPTDNREAFAATWTQRYCSRITEQLKKLGASCDWSRQRFTLDADYTRATTEAFIRLYHQGLIHYQNGNWYLKLSELAKPLIAALDNDEISISPSTAAQKFRQTPDGNSLLDAHDWEISRQLWWGHSIPAWQITGTDNWIIAHNEAEAYELAPLGSELIQSPDKLDTWFSSSLWSFAALGWPDNTTELERYLEAGILETGHDILFFWAAKMAMMSLALTGKLPFKKLYLHGLIRDEQGQKMSKSQGNGIEPLLLIEEYGADALRFALAANTSAGEDSQIRQDQLIAAKRFTNKIWNAGRYIFQQESILKPFLATEDEAFLKTLDTFKQQHNALLANYEFRNAATNLRSFFWHDFCDEYLESTKTRKSISAIYTTQEALRILLQMLHPFMPFITEKLWKQGGRTRTIMTSF